MVPGLFSPVVDPLEMVFGFTQRAVAGIDAQGVAEVEPAIALHIERRHTGCVGRVGI
jgi:hypothetical protein